MPRTLGNAACIDISRRNAVEKLTLLVGLAATLGAPREATAQASVQEQQIELDREIDKLLKGVPIRPGRVRIDLPAVADNGNSVACTISVDSPMSAADHVRTLHVWAARNPRPHVITAQFGPANPRARLDTRLRLGESQRLMAIAVMSDGSAWSGVADVTVLLSACVDGSG